MGFMTTHGTNKDNIRKAVHARIEDLFDFPCTWTNDARHSFRTETPGELMHAIENEIGFQEESFPTDDPIDEEDAAACSAQYIVNAWLHDWDYGKLTR